MKLNNDNLPINVIIKKIKQAATENQELTLTVDEVKLISHELGDQYFVPVLTNEQIVQLSKEGKLGHPIYPKSE